MDNRSNVPPDRQLEDSSASLSQFDAPRDSWVRRHGPLIVVMTAAFAYFMTQFNALSVILVVLGISLLIFVHELGHFLVAKWCDVHVLTFSIGLGPAIPGCSVRWGETTYKLGIIPLGGYVKMIGEGADEGDGDDDPRSFKNKSVGQRMAIISAGVTMNIIFGFASFVFVYMTHGEKRIPAVIDGVEVGSAAWQNGVRSSEVVRQIGSKKNPYFDDFLIQVMNSVKGEKLDLVVGSPDVPDDKLSHFKIEPQRRDSDQKPMVGVYFAPQELKLFPEAMKRHRPFPFRKESAAAQASPPFEFGDEILGTTDPGEPDNLEKILPLPPDPRTPENPQHLDYYDFHKRLQLLAGKTIVVQVRRAKSSKVEDITVPPDYHYVFPGLFMEMGEIVALRNESPAAKAGVQIKDVIEEVQVTDAQNRNVQFSTKTPTAVSGNLWKPLDPMRLNFDLNQWAAQKPGVQQVALMIRRGTSRQRLTLDWDDSWRFNNESPRPPRWSVSLAGLGIAYQVNTTVGEVEPNSPTWEKGIRKNDIVRACRFMKLGKKLDDPAEPDSWIELKPHEWAQVFAHCQAVDLKEVTLRLEREGKEITLHAQPDETWPSESRGLGFIPEFRLVKADNIGQAVAIGWGRTWDFITAIYGNLRGLATGQVSTDLMNGPITVAEAAYSVADEDFYQYVLFLGFISINLAVVNFLPIPVLDGGHMVFLIYESLMKRPASRQVRIATTYLGIAFIFSLMAFVIYLDLKKKFS
ncbi:MAG TPA: site-2 protease family protein [Gemmataceae bacterium]|jgi:regulator of sigma E protease|nr:site-2 protease family protein [Gemmataceae bacterium]